MLFNLFHSGLVLWASFLQHGSLSGQRWNPPGTTYMPSQQWQATGIVTSAPACTKFYWVALPLSHHHWFQRIFDSVNRINGGLTVSAVTFITNTVSGHMVAMFWWKKILEQNSIQRWNDVFRVKQKYYYFKSLRLDNHYTYFKWILKNFYKSYKLF